jgi:hypothetical protein
VRELTLSIMTVQRTVLLVVRQIRATSQTAQGFVGWGILRFRFPWGLRALLQ